MKLEQRRMFKVGGFNEPYEADVIYKDNKAFISSFAGDNEFYQLGDSDMLFDTKEEADRYHSKIISKFDAEEIKKYIEGLERYSDELKKMLPDDIYRGYKKGLNANMCLSYEDSNVLKMALNGILNIDSVSFRLSDINHINYGENWLSISLSNGKEITPRTDIEMFIIKSIFGDNNSRVYNKTIKKPVDL